MSDSPEWFNFFVRLFLRGFGDVVRGFDDDVVRDIAGGGDNVVRDFDNSFVRDLDDDFVGRSFGGGDCVRDLDTDFVERDFGGWGNDFVRGFDDNDDVGWGFDGASVVLDIVAGDDDVIFISIESFPSAFPLE